ncbi:hypothetical protein [Halobaculum rubrum]|uniref:hypothetical protein n=1 Tax=Halobaculum rubrum TaxID=2872158 RepID=UPI001CA44769|nr:hypothetical protein [Halobaculum rubrum]QZY00455.1 hypothetical protein K6T25_05015 [Halobaculum rubrum]
MTGEPTPPSAAPVRERLPRGDLVGARVATDFAAPLAASLDDDLTGYLRLEPGDALLGIGGSEAVITLESGVPVLAYDAGGDVDGPAALAALAGTTPVRVERYRLPADALDSLHDPTADGNDPFRVAPGAPARELAGDDALAERTREAAPAERRAAGGDHDALAAFLADEERVEAVRREARAEARARADEWGLGDQLAE